jgi:hypothetical protein
VRESGESKEEKMKEESPPTHQTRVSYPAEQGARVERLRS